MASRTNKTDIHGKRMREKEIVHAHGKALCFGTSPQRPPKVDSYIVFRHSLRPYRAVPHWGDLETPGRRVAACANRPTSSRVLQHQPTHPLVRCISNHYNILRDVACSLLDRNLALLPQRGVKSASLLVQRAIPSPNVPSFTWTPCLRTSRIESWSRCIGIVRAPCDP